MLPVSLSCIQISGPKFWKFLQNVLLSYSLKIKQINHNACLVLVKIFVLGVGVGWQYILNEMSYLLYIFVFRILAGIKVESGRIRSGTYTPLNLGHKLDGLEFASVKWDPRGDGFEIGDLTHTIKGTWLCALCNRYWNPSAQAM